MEATTPIILCAQQRSGTTVLQKALDASGKCENYGEVFHGGSFSTKRKSLINFFNFKKRIILGNADYFFPSHENQKEIFVRYFNFLKSKSRLDFCLIDIKYNSWHHFNPVWYSTESTPQLLIWIKQQRIPVIHIIRENLLHQYISSKVAEATGKFHYKKEEKSLGNKQIYIDPKRCRAYIVNVNRDIKNYQRWFKGYQFYFEITYEEMIENNAFSKKIEGIVEEITNGQLKKLPPPPLKKGTKDSIALIENIEEVKEILKGTPYYRFFHKGSHKK